MTELSSQPKKSTAVAVAIAWLFVALPTAWGVFNTVKTATLLFRSSPATQSTSGTAR